MLVALVAAGAFGAVPGRRGIAATALSVVLGTAMAVLVASTWRVGLVS